MKCSAIYKIQSKIKPERFYIGSAVSIQKRWAEHQKGMLLGKHENKILQRHYDKYGKDDLVFTIIEPCFKEFLLIREQYYIDTLRPTFNIRMTAGSNLGIRYSAETRRKMSIVQKNRNYMVTPETCAKISESCKGRSVWNKGKKTGVVPSSTFKKGSVLSPARVIFQYDLEMNFIREWERSRLAHKELDISLSSIRKAAIGLQKQAGGFVWRYKTIDFSNESIIS